MEERVDAVTDVAEPQPGREPRRRRARGAAESLGSIVLGFESLVVFLGGLAVYGLRALPAAVPPWWGIAGGSVAAVLMILTAGVLRWRWGMALGWVLQAVVAASALLVPAMIIVAIIFGGMWAYATIKGASLDRRNARLRSETDLENGQ